MTDIRTLRLAIISGMLTATFSAQGFTEREVTVNNLDAGLSLAGTLTAPDKGKPKAAIVMATGSGQQNRDEEIFGHRPFKVIAEYLSENGYVVLRLDDRGAGCSDSGNLKKATTDDFAGDISAATAWLDSCYTDLPTGIIGHSEGGTIAIKNAVHNHLCDFIVTLAAPALSLDSINMLQLKALSQAAGQNDEFNRIRPIVRRRYDKLKSDASSFLLRGWLYSDISAQVGDAARLPEIQKQIAKESEMMLSPWFRSALRYDPANDIAAISVPWLALNGDRDVQVDISNLGIIHDLNPGVCTIVMEHHNHLFQRCTTGLPDEYATIEEDISDQTTRTILNWLDNNISCP